MIVSKRNYSLRKIMLIVAQTKVNTVLKRGTGQTHVTSLSYYFTHHISTQIESIITPTVVLTKVKIVLRRVIMIVSKRNYSLRKIMLIVAQTKVKTVLKRGIGQTHVTSLSYYFKI